MKNWLFAVAVVVASTLAVAPSVSDAKRFGGGSSSGMQRSMPKRDAGQAGRAAAGRTGQLARARRRWRHPPPSAAGWARSPAWPLVWASPR